MKVALVTDWDEARRAALAAAAGAGVEIHAFARGELDALVARAGTFDAAVGGRLPRAFFEAAGRLRWLVIPYAGVPAQDRQVLRDFPRVTVVNSHFNARAAAEHAWALLLAAAKRLPAADRRLRAGDWTMRHEGPWSLQLRGATLLLVGYGHIGRALAGYGRAFGMKVLAVRRRGAGEAEAAGGAHTVGAWADLPRLLPEADAVILSLPGTERTRGLFGRAEFAAMKPGAVFVNVGRGETVDEDAFADALRTGRLGAAGVDTWWRYPESRAAAAATPPSRHDLSSFENLVMSPHRASHVDGREDDRLAALAALLRALAAGRPPAPVDREAGY